MWHQPNHLLPDQDSDDHILNALDEDCLRVIFKKLNLVD